MGKRVDDVLYFKKVGEQRNLRQLSKRLSNIAADLNKRADEVYDDGLNIPIVAEERGYHFLPVLVTRNSMMTSGLWSPSNYWEPQIYFGDHRFVKQIEDGVGCAICPAKRTGLGINVSGSGFQYSTMVAGDEPGKVSLEVSMKCTVREKIIDGLNIKGKGSVADRQRIIDSLSAMPCSKGRVDVLVIRNESYC